MEDQSIKSNTRKKGDQHTTTMLEYFKILLHKLSFNSRLFRKEYRKTFRYLKPSEQDRLKEWLRKAPENTKIQ
ncbi:MAG: hypothetical protein RIC30_02320 [Marinoscillum sp.]|uniref:hypothetical protein n=1 Tax=Marinoscillum sp. TaxID=2024838 RepID=UPI0032F809E9